MAVKLRLRRMGKKKQPIYKIVAADSRSPRDGKFLEAIGLYNPLTEPSTIEVNEDRAMYWLNNGAQPSDTVKSLLSKKGIILKRELTRRGMSEEKIQEEIDNWAKLREAKEKTKAEKKAKATEKKKSESKAKEEQAVEEEKLESEETKAEAKTEKTDSQKEEEVSSEENNESTTEVKGAASEENPEEEKK